MARSAGSAHTRLVLSLVLLAAVCQPAYAPVPTLCATDSVHIINSVIGIANTVAQVAVDCTLPGLNELSCAGDITGLLASLLDFGTLISDMTLVCGDLDNSCATQIMVDIEVVAGLAATLIATSADCLSDPFICTYDVVSAIDTMNTLIYSIIASVKICDQADIHSHDSQMDFQYPGQVGSVLDRYANLEFQGSRGIASFQRRLQEAFVDNRAMNTTMDPTSKTADLDALRAKLNIKLDSTRSALEARGVKDIPSPNSLLALAVAAPKPAEKTNFV